MDDSDLGDDDKENMEAARSGCVGEDVHKLLSKGCSCLDFCISMADCHTSLQLTELKKAREPILLNSNFLTEVVCGE